MPGFVHGGALPPRPPTPEEIEAAKKKVAGAEKRNADRLAEIALRGTKKSLRAPVPPAPAPKPAQPPAQAAKPIVQKPAPAKPAGAAPAPAPAPKPAASPPPPQAAQVNDLPKDEGEEETFTEDEKSILEEGEGGVLDAESDL